MFPLASRETAKLGFATTAMIISLRTCYGWRVINRRGPVDLINAKLVRSVGRVGGGRRGWARWRWSRRGGWRWERARGPRVPAELEPERSKLGVVQAVGCISLSVEPSQGGDGERGRITVRNAGPRDPRPSPPRLELVSPRRVHAVEANPVTGHGVGDRGRVPDASGRELADPPHRHGELELHPSEEVNRRLHQVGIVRVHVHAIEDARGWSAGKPFLPLAKNHALVQAVVPTGESQVILDDRRIIEDRFRADIAGERVVAMTRRGVHAVAILIVAVVGE